MKVNFFATLLLAFAFAANAAPSFRLADSEMLEFVQNAVEKEKRAPGIGVGVTDETGSRVIAFGTLGRPRPGNFFARLVALSPSWNQQWTNKVDGDTIFEIGSITKTFTTLLLQDMVDRGEVKLDDPISKFLPASVKTPTRNGKEITLLDLATHTSGLPRLPFSTGYLLWRLNDPYVDFKVKDFYKFLSTFTLTNDIGTHFEYSNAGMQLLGHCLELAAKTNYESLVRERICQPLGMDSTCILLSPEQKKRAAAGHAWGDFVDSWSPSDFPADGELRSTANDMLKFLAANLGLTNSTLSNAMAQTHVPQRKTDSRISEEVGLGWFIHTRTGVRWHNGQVQGFVSYTAFNEADHRGVIVLANSECDIEDLGEFIIGIRKWRKAVPLDPAIYQRYTGKYQFDAKRVTTISRRGHRLFLQVTGRKKFEMFPESETEFFLKAGDVQAKFLRDQSGQPTGLVWYQDGSKGTELKRLGSR